MTLSEWLTYLETLHPQPMALELDRVHQVGQHLGVNHFDIPVITVGGTNGKGSCVALLSAIWQAQGYSVGAYASPHLIHFSERITIRGISVSEEDLCNAFTIVENARQDIPLTYFEFTTLAALWLFHQANLDGVILEVGLGGRLDAVNIVDPSVSVITTIALDHEAWLGNTREAIGYEKAGIFRPHRTAICGDFATPLTVLEHAAAIHAPLFLQNRDFHYQKNAHTWDWQSPQYHWTNLPIPQLPIQNASTALMVIAALQDRLPTAETAIQQGLSSANVFGRFQCFSGKPTVILDVAHNPASASLLAERLSTQTGSGKTHAVIGMLADKDIRATLSAMRACVDFWWVGGLTDIPRGAEAQKLTEPLRAWDCVCHESPSVSRAFQEALAHSDECDRIVVFGSFHTVSPILAFLQQETTTWTYN